MMGDLVLSNVKEGKWDTGLLAKFLLTEKLINEKPIFRNNIPTFHYSMCEAIPNSLKKLF